MYSGEMLLSGAVSPALEKMVKAEDASEAKKIQFAKDFESVFINKLLEEMKSTIGNWGLEKDEASKQVDGIFWLYLAQDMADNGGLGMWKDIYQSLDGMENKNIETKLLDANL